MIYVNGEEKKQWLRLRNAGNYFMVWNSRGMTEEMEELLVLAEEACDLAYALYFNYRVGAVVLTEKGVFKGANIENAPSNLGVCYQMGLL